MASGSGMPGDIAQVLALQQGDHNTERLNHPMQGNHNTMQDWNRAHPMQGDQDWRKAQPPLNSYDFGCVHVIADCAWEH